MPRSTPLFSRRHEADLACELSPVVVGVVALDQAVLDREQVDALQVDACARWLEALERSAAEGARVAPAHGHLVVLRDHVEHLEVRVGEGREQLGEELPHLVRDAQLADGDDVLHAAGSPAVDHGVDVACCDGAEVALREAGGIACRPLEPALRLGARCCRRSTGPASVCLCPRWLSARSALSSCSGPAGVRRSCPAGSRREL